MLHDLWHAVRALRRSPGVTLSAIVVLGVGIGATVAIFSVVYPVVLTPLPFDDPDRLVIAWQQDAQGDLREVSYPGVSGVAGSGTFLRSDGGDRVGQLELRDVRIPRRQYLNRYCSFVKIARLVRRRSGVGKRSSSIWSPC